MRLFVGLEIDPAVARRLDDCSSELRRRTSAIAPRARINWVAVDRLHVTVQFIGEVDASRGQAIQTVLQPSIDQASFDMHVRGVGAFPQRGLPRVIWAGVHASAEALTRLERAVAARLVACGVASENRPYHPHVTLARVREAFGLRSAGLLEGMTDRDSGVSPVEAVTLFESRPSPRGSSYVVLQRTLLAPADVRVED